MTALQEVFAVLLRASWQASVLAVLVAACQWVFRKRLSPGWRGVRDRRRDVDRGLTAILVSGQPTDHYPDRLARAAGLIWSPWL